jgi:hypothetical protein
MREMKKMVKERNGGVSSCLRLAIGEDGDAKSKCEN